MTRKRLRNPDDTTVGIKRFAHAKLKQAAKKRGKVIVGVVTALATNWSDRVMKGEAVEDSL